MRRTLVVTCVLASLSAACASGGGSPGAGSAVPMPSASTASGTSPQTSRKGNSALITQDDITQANVTNAYEAIQRLRPQWLRGRGATSGRQLQGQESPNTLPSLYVDNSSYGELSQLANIPSGNVREIQFLSSTEATTKWGTNNTGGAILVLTRK